MGRGVEPKGRTAAMQAEGRGPLRHRPRQLDTDVGVGVAGRRVDADPAGRRRRGQPGGHLTGGDRRAGLGGRDHCQLGPRGQVGRGQGGLGGRRARGPGGGALTEQGVGPQEEDGDHDGDDHQRGQAHPDREASWDRPRVFVAAPLTPARPRGTGLTAVRLRLGRSGGCCRPLHVPRAGGDPRAGGRDGRRHDRRRGWRWGWGRHIRSPLSGRTPHRDQPVEGRGRGPEAVAGIGDGGGHVVRHRALQAADGARMVGEEPQAVRVEAVRLDDLGPARRMRVRRRCRRETPVVGAPASERGVELTQAPEEPVQVSARLGLLGPGGGIERIHVIPSVASAESDHASLQARSARSSCSLPPCRHRPPGDDLVACPGGSARCIPAVTRRNRG